MDPLTLALIGGGLGIVKGMSDKEKEQRQRKLQSEIARYSAWSGMKPDLSQIKEADMVGSIMQGGLTGALVGQSIAPKSAALTGEADAAAPVPTAAGTGGAPMSPNITREQLDAWLLMQGLPPSYR